MPPYPSMIRYWSEKYPKRTSEDIFLGGNDPRIEISDERILGTERYAIGLGDHPFTYADRGQPDGEKNRTDHFYGKIGEFIAQDDIEQYIRLSQKTDLKIYGNNKKSFDSDLKSGKICFQVKTHNVFNCGYPSWVIEDKDRTFFGRDWTMPRKDIVVVFVNIAYERNVSGKIIRLRGKVYSYNWLSELHGKEMFLELKNTIFNNKRAVYSNLLHSYGMIHSLKEVLLDKLPYLKFKTK